jgi:hypothetical protein
VRLWNVRVRCDYMEGPSLPKKCYERAIVEAPTSGNALDRGEKFIEANAPRDMHWIGFQAIEAASVELPIRVKAL